MRKQLCTILCGVGLRDSKQTVQTFYAFCAIFYKNVSSSEIFERIYILADYFERQAQIQCSI